MLLALVAAAHAITNGERLEWAVTWMGISAGRAWASVRASGEGWSVEAGGRSASWLAELYPVDDWLLSEWAPGSRRYRTRFREGRFQQDQEWRMGADGIVVARSQRFDEGWRSWENAYPAIAGVEDPISALFRLREEPGDATFPVWSGRKAGRVVARTVGRETLTPRSGVGGEALRVEVATGYGNADVKSTLTLYLSDDADRVPLAAVLHTRAGPVRLDLARRTLE